MRVTFNELAERELNDAAHYYELEQSGLGGAFITDIQRCTQAIEAYPLAGPIVLGTIRRRLCQRFPIRTPLYRWRERTPHSRGHASPSAARVLGGPDMTGGPTSGCSRRRLLPSWPPRLNRER